MSLDVSYQPTFTIIGLSELERGHLRVLQLDSMMFSWLTTLIIARVSFNHPPDFLAKVVS